MKLILSFVVALSLSMSALDPIAAQTVTAEAQLLKAGDAVQLRVWREEDLSGEFPVDESGIIVFPKIGPLKVTDQSPESLKATLLASYQRYLRNPSIEIVFLRRVTVLGGVRKPGVYAVTPLMTISDVLALAGGATPEAAPDRLEIMRGGERLTTRVSERTRVADSPIRSGDQLYVPERTWMSRNTGLFATIISAATSVVIALIIR